MKYSRNAEGRRREKGICVQSRGFSYGQLGSRVSHTWSWASWSWPMGHWCIPAHLLQPGRAKLAEKGSGCWARPVSLSSVRIRRRKPQLEEDLPINSRTPPAMPPPPRRISPPLPPPLRGSEDPSRSYASCGLIRSRVSSGFGFLGGFRFILLGCFSFPFNLWMLFFLDRDSRWR